MLTKDQLVTLINRIESLRQEWDAQKPEERGGIWRELCDAFARLRQSIDTHEVEQEAWAIVLLADDVADRYADWEHAVGALRDPALGFTKTLWEAVAQLVAEVARKPPKQESVAELVAQGISYGQVAKLCNWYTATGSGTRVPDIDKVREELRNPGTHRPAPDPREIERLLAIEERWAARGPARLRKLLRQRPPETLEDLLDQKVPLRQIGKMFHVSMDEVRRVAQAAGIVPEEDVPPMSEQQRRFARDQETARILRLDSHPEAADLRERVLLLHADGLPDADIVAVLRANGRPEASYSLIRRFLVAAKADGAEASVQGDNAIGANEG